MTKTIILNSVVLIFLLNALVLSAAAQTTAFNFQGRLNDGSQPANGRYDVQFRLFDSITGGSQVGPAVERQGLMLMNGVFSTTLDFGGSAFSAGNRFIEISVRPNGSPNSHVILGGRQQIMSVPFAVRAERSTTSGLADLATNAVNAVNADQANIATTAVNANRLGDVLAGEYVKKNTPNSGNLLMQGSINANGNLGTGADLGVVGNATQNTPSFGLPKAMVYIGVDAQSNGFIRNCYNGFTGSVSPPCGYTLTNPVGGVGVYRIDFGFPIDGRFINATPFFDTPAFDYGVSLKYNAQFLEVFVFGIRSSQNTVAKPVVLTIF